MGLKFGQFLGCLVAHGAPGASGWLPPAIGSARQAKAEHRGAKLTPEQEAAFIVAAERWAGPPAFP
jgi:hypothetical protein